MGAIGIIGTGWGARAQAPAFRKAGLNVVALAGRDPNKTARLARELGIPQVFSDWTKLVASAEVDLVSVVTPPATHVEMSLAALQAGKHLLCEKPTALDAEEAQRLVDAARRHPDRITLIDHELRFLPSFREARTRIHDLGRIHFAEGRYASPGRSDPARPWNWWSSAAEGGGVLGAVGSHFVDAFRYLIGEIIAVRATLETRIAQRPDAGGIPREVTSDDCAALTLRFEDESIADIVLSVIAGVDEPTTWTIHGENGSLRLVGDQLLIAERRGHWREVVEGEREVNEGDSQGGFFGTGTVYLGHALRIALDQGNREELAPAATFEDGLAQQRILDAARRSSQAGGGWEKI